MNKKYRIIFTGTAAEQVTEIRGIHEQEDC
ncbi:MAG: hypothetical protein CDV28_12222 [Candidatus Electronema aureum]|uniref:Uncharacterized protein n=1 Tax=Candidatus Electronema aureum TaxID=2005002 RepID=A0A521G0Q2_9BACT|nr:MAG: hypothetical protein CDV28_12222 [Candidatus Electronema aureum]